VLRELREHLLAGAFRLLVLDALHGPLAEIGRKARNQLLRRPVAQGEQVRHAALLRRQDQLGAVDRRLFAEDRALEGAHSAGHARDDVGGAAEKREGAVVGEGGSIEASRGVLDWDRAFEQQGPVVVSVGERDRVRSTPG
jgi:hypothetical protein